MSEASLNNQRALLYIEIMKYLGINDDLHFARFIIVPKYRIYFLNVFYRDPYLLKSVKVWSLNLKTLELAVTSKIQTVLPQNLLEQVRLLFMGCN